MIIKKYEIAIGKKVIRDNSLYESSKQTYDLRIFKTIRSSVYSIYNHKMKIHELIKNKLIY